MPLGGLSQQDRHLSVASSSLYLDLRTRELPLFCLGTVVVHSRIAWHGCFNIPAALSHTGLAL